MLGPFLLRAQLSDRLCGIVTLRGHFLGERPRCTDVVDVRIRSEPAHDLARCITQRVDSGQEPARETIHAAQRKLHLERTSNISLVTLGLAPLAGEVGPLLRSARRFGRPLYDFEGLRAFKAKLKPNVWDPIFLSYPPHRSSLLAIVDTLTAFARGGLLRFGLQSMLRGPAIVIRLLATLLVVWTVLLALPVSAPFFPSPGWQWSWVGFDIALFLSLFTLARRWRQPLADIVTVAVTADAAVTTIEAVVYNAPRVDGLFDIAVIAVAVLAPSLAAVLLWNTRGHRTPSD